MLIYLKGKANRTCWWVACKDDGKKGRPTSSFFNWATEYKAAPFAERGRNEFEEGNHEFCFASLMFEMLIRHPGGDISYADEYMSLEFQGDIRTRYKLRSHQQRVWYLKPRGHIRSSWEWVVDMGKKRTKVKILEWTNVEDWEKTKELDGPVVREEN